MRLNQILAIEKGIKTRVYADFSALHQATKKPDLLEGFTHTYTPKQENGEQRPPENKRVQYLAEDVFRQVQKLLVEMFDITATKDYANCTARADIVVDGQKLLESVPATYLLFLDKQLADLHKFFTSFVELDPSAEWAKDDTTGGHRTPSIRTQRTEKAQRPIVLYDATEHHPAQTQLITEDTVVGHWDKVRISGAVPRPRKQALVDRTEKLMHAVKFALEQANTIDAPKQTVGDAVFGYLFGNG